MMNNSYLLSKHLNHQLINLYLQAFNLYLSPEDQFVIKEDDQSMLSQSVTCNETIDVFISTKQNECCRSHTNHRNPYRKGHQQLQWLFIFRKPVYTKFDSKPCKVSQPDSRAE